MTLSHKEFSSRGGKKRAKNLTTKRKKEIAMMGVKARIDKKNKVLVNE